MLDLEFNHLDIGQKKNQQLKRDILQIVRIL